MKSESIQLIDIIRRLSLSFIVNRLKQFVHSFFSPPLLLATNNNIPLRPPPTSSSSSTASSSSNQVTVGPCGSKSANSGSGMRKDKTTRMRTVLNEKQLLTLRTCYSANPRPDALMKEQLVEMTQLSPRVIRVWFQNKRTSKKKTIFLFDSN